MCRNVGPNSSKRKKLLGKFKLMVEQTGLPESSLAFPGCFYTPITILAVDATNPACLDILLYHKSRYMVVSQNKGTPI